MSYGRRMAVRSCNLSIRGVQDAVRRQLDGLPPADDMPIVFSLDRATMVGRLDTVMCLPGIQLAIYCCSVAGSEGATPEHWFAYRRDSSETSHEAWELLPSGLTSPRPADGYGPAMRLSMLGELLSLWAVDAWAASPLPRSEWLRRESYRPETGPAERMKADEVIAEAERQFRRPDDPGTA
jgi:hypothetical protein